MKQENLYLCRRCKSYFITENHEIDINCNDPRKHPITWLHTCGDCTNVVKGVGDLQSIAYFDEEVKR